MRIMIGAYVVVRTYSAGVHAGFLKSCAGTAVVLTEATRIWKWHGAFSLNEVSQNGCSESSRISVSVPEILLTQAVEVIPCSEKAKANLQRTRNNASR